MQYKEFHRYVSTIFCIKLAQMLNVNFYAAFNILKTEK